MQAWIQLGTLRVLSGIAIVYKPDSEILDRLFIHQAYTPISQSVSRSPFYIGTPHDY